MSDRVEYRARSSRPEDEHLLDAHGDPLTPERWYVWEELTHQGETGEGVPVLGPFVSPTAAELGADVLRAARRKLPDAPLFAELERVDESGEECRACSGSGRVPRVMPPGLMACPTCQGGGVMA